VDIKAHTGYVGEKGPLDHGKRKKGIQKGRPQHGTVGGCTRPRKEPVQFRLAFGIGLDGTGSQSPQAGFGKIHEKLSKKAKHAIPPETGFETTIRLSSLRRCIGAPEQGLNSFLPVFSSTSGKNVP
jgi:hypothetical protein